MIKQQHQQSKNIFLFVIFLWPILFIFALFRDKALKNAPTMRTIYKQLDDVQSEDISSKIMSKHSTTSANLPVEEASIVKEISSTEKPITLITSKTPLQENVK